LAVIGVVGLWYILPFRIFWRFDHIEQHVKKQMSATELQQWALQVMALHPVAADSEQVRIANLPVPLPKPLSNVWRHLPDIYIFNPDTNATPAYMSLTWGGGFIGHCGIEIGPTNFVSFRSEDKWQDGVYFWKTH
jgi:hypothetical protein